jgi:hypothetical protein
LTGRDIEALRATLAKANDEEVTRLVAMLDRMRDRGALDGLVAVVRPRLARLRPERPLSFVRLLFLPLDPLIVPAGIWRFDQPAIPRIALRPLADTVRAALGGAAPIVDEIIKGGVSKGSGSREPPNVARAGALLWPAAADAIARSVVPADWTERTGLSEAEYGVLADNVALVMAQVPRLRCLVAEVEVGLPIRPDALHAMLRIGQPVALAMMMTLILGCLPQAMTVLAPRRGRNRALAPAMDTAKLMLLGRFEAQDVIEAAVMSANAQVVAADIRRTVMLLRMLQEETAPGSAVRVQRLLGRLDDVCLARVAAGMRRDFIGRLERLTPDADDDEIIRLEDTVRGLGEIAVAGSMIGGNRAYGILVQQMVDAVETYAPPAPLTRGDRARMIELLIGPAGAWRILETLPGN